MTSWCPNYMARFCMRFARVSASMRHSRSLPTMGFEARLQYLVGTGYRLGARRGKMSLTVVKRVKNTLNSAHAVGTSVRGEDCFLFSSRWARKDTGLTSLLILRKAFSSPLLRFALLFWSNIYATGEVMNRKYQGAFCRN